MKHFTVVQRGILLIAVLVVVSMAAMSYMLSTRLLPEQVLAQQKSLSPAVALVTQHFMEPLHVAQTLGRSTEIAQIMSVPVDEHSVFSTLNRLKREFGMEFFIASEPARHQFFSSGRQHAIIEGDTNWYFKFKNLPDDAIADVGRWDDPQFYIDIKIYDNNGEFVGFFGTAKKLDSFITVFSEYKQQYGYDFIFVDNNNRIMLSSDPNLSPHHSQFTYLSDVSWFQKWQTKHPGQTLNNALIDSQNGQNLVTEIDVPPFGWRVLIISPLQAQQSALTQQYFLFASAIIIALVLAFSLILRSLRFFKHSIQEKISSDPLTGLLNRDFIHSHYEALNEKQGVALIILDLDHFKRINDEFGHNVGDRALINVSKRLDAIVNKPHLLARWGGEEFVVLMPAATLDDAAALAKKLNESLARKPFTLYGQLFTITASFGVAASHTKQDLDWLVGVADKALYKAKHNGRNRVELMANKTLHSVST